MQKQAYHQSFPTWNTLDLVQSKETAIFPLRTYVERVLNNYFRKLGDQQPIKGLYDTILKEVDTAVLKVASEHFKTQTKISSALTLSRQTVRKKLKVVKEHPSI